MLRRIPRILRRAVLVTVLLAVTTAVVQSWTAGTPGSGGWVQTEFGPLGPADRDLLVKVRLAGLWEGPTGEQAQQQASSTEVQELGAILAGEHADLDVEVRKVADQLGVLLPSSPSAQQLAWMDELSALTGSEYDRVAVQRWRQAHGTVLPAIAEVRAGTRNELIREFAAVADEYVSRHIGHLESTGLVDYDAMAAPRSPGLLSGEAAPADLVLPALIFLAALLAAAGVVVAMRRGDPDRPRPRYRDAIPEPDHPRPEPMVAIPAPRPPQPSHARHAMRS